MLRRLIANSLIVVSCLGVFVPVAFALQPAPMMACCRRSGHHQCKCCSGKKSGSSGSEFRDNATSCPCSSQIPTRTVRGDLPQHVVPTLASPTLDTLSDTSWLPCRSIDQIQQSERGPPTAQR